MKETTYYCNVCKISLTKEQAMIAYIRMYSEQSEREIHLCSEHYEALKPRQGNA